MKLPLKSMTLTAIISAFLISCDKNESPEITIHELGYENTKTVTAGSDLHIDAEIMAPLKIASIQLIIHSEEEHAASMPMKAKKMNQEVTEWEVDSIYTKGYVGVKNAEFHEHLDVPLTTELGHYHVHIKVTDMEGNQTVKENEIEVIAPN
jgi:hypothetical protein